MSLEQTIQLLTDSAAEQEAKLARLEENSALLEQALERLTQRQRLLEIWAVEVQALLEEIEQRSFRRGKSLRSHGYRQDHTGSYWKCRPAQRPPRHP
jgi:hypothetical protein